MRARSNGAWGLIEQPKVSRSAHTLLVLLGLMALAASWRAVSNYVGSLTSVRSLELELTSVRRADDDSAQLIVQFRLHNRSPLPIRLNSYFFELSLNGERIGGSNSAWLGGARNADHALYRRASTIEQILAPHRHLDMVFPLYVFELDRIIAGRQALAASPDRRGASEQVGAGVGQSAPFEQARIQTLAWSVEAGLRLIHPYGRDERLVRLRAALQE